jgi:hypothetical protein
LAGQKSKGSLLFGPSQSPPAILKRFASKSAERIAGNEMALDVDGDRRPYAKLLLAASADPRRLDAERRSAASTTRSLRVN